MKNTNIVIIGFLALIVGLGIGYLVWGTSARTPAGYHMMSGNSAMGQNIDQHFIAQMLPHHEGAIEMAKVALERSQRQEILSLAEAIIEAQEAENAQMRAWYQAWFGSAPPAGGFGMMGGGHMMGMEGDTRVLASISAEEFDREFILQMIPHHEMAIMMADMLAAGTQRPEMKQLADNITTSQSREIEMMRSWLASWY